MNFDRMMGAYQKMEKQITAVYEKFFDGVITFNLNNPWQNMYYSDIKISSQGYEDEIEGAHYSEFFLVLNKDISRFMFSCTKPCEFLFYVNEQLEKFIVDPEMLMFKNIVGTPDIIILKFENYWAHIKVIMDEAFMGEQPIKYNHNALKCTEKI